MYDEVLSEIKIHSFTKDRKALYFLNNWGSNNTHPITKTEVTPNVNIKMAFRMTSIRLVPSSVAFPFTVGSPLT